MFNSGTEEYDIMSSGCRREVTYYLSTINYISKEEPSSLWGISGCLECGCLVFMDCSCKGRINPYL